MRTLLITSIYSHLWGSEYGGRPSRGFHYRASLLNILNTAPTKVVCFTSNDELPSLESHFYDSNNIDPNLLEFKTFELNQSNYFNLIRSKKDLEEMKKLDRCFEIQYNKFFWYDLIEDRNDYDRVYWIDAGLSHTGIFPGEFRDITTGQERYYSVNLFKPTLLDKFNELTENSTLLLAKNNTGSFFWSQLLPQKYFNEYNPDKHIIGGLFGGTPENYQELRDDFESQLTQVLNGEDILYMEEQIMTCMYRNNEEKYTLLEFDDWYKRDRHKGKEYKYFYHMFL